MEQSLRPPLSTEKGGTMSNGQKRVRGKWTKGDNNKHLGLFGGMQVTASMFCWWYEKVETSQGDFPSKWSQLVEEFAKHQWPTEETKLLPVAQRTSLYPALPGYMLQNAIRKCLPICKIGDLAALFIGGFDFKSYVYNAVIGGTAFQRFDSTDSGAGCWMDEKTHSWFLKPGKCVKGDSVCMVGDNLNNAAKGKIRDKYQSIADQILGKAPATLPSREAGWEKICREVNAVLRESLGGIKATDIGKFAVGAFGSCVDAYRWLTSSATDELKAVASSDDIATEIAVVDSQTHNPENSLINNSGDGACLFMVSRPRKSCMASMTCFV